MTAALLHELVPVDRLVPSTYNPRATDPARLDLIELSLRKLGFVLPIYAQGDGEILSGHQRHLVATRMGCRQVPVAWLPPLALDDRKALNIAFNRGTNDLRPHDTPTDLTRRLAAANAVRLAEQLPDLAPDTPAFFACLAATAEPLAPLLVANAGRWLGYARNLARTLARQGVRMPLVAGPDGVVVNGVGRLQHAAEQRDERIEVVRLDQGRAAFAEAMLNLLSMEFDVQTRYRDLLRYNSFRRARRFRSTLGRGFVAEIVGPKPANTFDIARPADRARWLALYGSSIVDFGAGHLHETKLLRAQGVHVAPFEPYRVVDGSDAIDLKESRTLTREFLADVASGRPYTSVFISSVLNSVPFVEDRRQLATVCAALCGPRTRLFACATSTASVGWQRVGEGKDYLDRTHGKGLAFALGYEPGIQLGDITDRPKVQKFHTPAEFRDLFAPLFGRVAAREREHCVEAACAEPLPIDRAALRAAIIFEFDLPYPDSKSLGMVDEAMQAFSTRLGVPL
jgi:hypothetical protein